MSRVAVPARAEVGSGHTLGAAHATGAPLLWVVERGVEPRPDALEQLLAVAGEPDAPMVASALVTDAAGVPVERLAPRGVQEDLEAMIVAAAEHRLPVRSVRGGCVLVRREAVDAFGLPDERLGRFAFAEWSLRALADVPGCLVPRARAVLHHPDSGPDLRALPDAIRAARRGRWGAGRTLLTVAEILGR